MSAKHIKILSDYKFQYKVSVPIHDFFKNNLLG